MKRQGGWYVDTGKHKQATTLCW